MSRTTKNSAPRLVYDLWPEVGQMLGLTRNATYQAANRGDIPTMRFGKLFKVPKAALDKLLETAGCVEPEVKTTKPKAVAAAEPNFPTDA